MPDKNKIQIIAIFQELAFRYGLRNITLDKVAKECRISKKTIYKYFPNKESLVLSGVDELYQLFLDEYARVRVEKDPLRNIVQLIQVPHRILGTVSMETFNDVMHSYPDVRRRMEEIKETYSRLFLEQYSLGVELGMLKNVNPVIVYTMVRQIATMVLDPDFFLKNGLSVQHTILVLTDLFFGGICRSADHASHIEQMLEEQQWS